MIKKDVVSYVPPDQDMIDAAGNMESWFTYPVVKFYKLTQ